MDAVARIVDGEEYLTVEEAARLLGVKPATLYAYVSRGLLRSYREGMKRQRLYRRAEVEALEVDLGVIREGHGRRDGAVPRLLLDQMVHGLGDATI